MNLRPIFAISVLAAGILSGKAQVNVALNATVTLNGTFYTDGWSTAVPDAAPGDIVNGVFQTETTEWDINSVWWNANDSDAENNNIVINLGGTFTIGSFVVQADDNDDYHIAYWDSGTSSWIDAWDIPEINSYGLVTRYDTLASPIVTSELLFTATGGDGEYAVSQIEAFSTPDGSWTCALLGGSLAAVAFLRRRFLRV
jgi:hypothetical protein